MGAFSVVVDASRGRTRRLPSLYVNDVQLYADRDVGRVVDALRHAVDAFVHSAERATYMLTACEIGGRTGLYGGDFFNRSAYRRKLERLGARFSNESFVVLREDDTFEAQDFPAFDPSFLVLGAPPEDHPGVERVAGAMLLYQLVFYRIADIAAGELARLGRLAGHLVALATADPADLVAAVRREPA